MHKIYLLGLFVALALCGQAQNQHHQISAQGFAFTPNNLVIEAGDTVTWTNNGGLHNVNGSLATYPGNPAGFTNGAPSSAAWTFTFVFTQPGTYTYQCDVHVGLNMVGFITVNDTQGPTGEVVISEIMYNPPEVGTDSLEFVELYNNGPNAVNLLGWSFTQGITYTFTSGYNLGAGEYVILAVDSVKFERNFNVPAFQFTGSLSNNGEFLELRDANSNVVDSLDFDDSFPWPTDADGNGASLVLCDVNSDNADGANWRAATTPTGVFAGALEVFANPGAASQCPTGATVGFVATAFTTTEGENILVQVALSNGGGQPALSVQVSAGAAGTAQLGVDFNYDPLTLTFPAGVVTDTLTVGIFTIDDLLPEALETAILELTMPDQGLTIDGPRGTFTLTIADNDTQIPDIVITEIFYNAPGVDDPFEFLELYNNDDQAVNLAGYYFSLGIVDTLPNYNFLPGDFLILAKDSVSFTATFGVPALQWNTGGSLNNSGETIELRDALGNVVDAVAYGASAPWPTAANGNGASLVLCDVDADNNDVANWAASGQQSGAVVNGVPVLASPGLANDCTSQPVNYPLYTIGQVSNTNAEGVADSLGVRAQLQGVVYGVNLRGATGLQFTIIDENNDGIAVFSSSNTFGYTVVEGDEVVVRGVVAQFNGLTQLNLDDLSLVSMGNPLFARTNVTVLDESTESQLVEILDVELVDPAQWTNTGPGFNVQVRALEGGATYEIRIDADVDLYGTPAPPTPFAVTGLGGQFDNAAPFTEGYQLLPRYIDDISLIVDSNEPGWAQQARIFPNPATEAWQVQVPVACQTATLTDALGRNFGSWSPQSEQFGVPAANLPAGVYFLLLTDGAHYYRYKVIKS